METGGWNYAKRSTWRAPVVRQLFEGEAAERYRYCQLNVCERGYHNSTGIPCRPVCELAIEARLRALGTGATRPKGDGR